MRPEREPVFNAPWQPVALIASIVGGYALQELGPWRDAVWVYAFSPTDLSTGRWETVVTSLFLHGGWPHALMNGAFALAFGAPLARFLGPRALGSVAFFAFYLACGALASLGFGVLHAGEQATLVGASGAVSGLAAAAARLIAGRGERMGPFRSPAVIGMTATWVAVNVLIGIVGFAPGAGNAEVAWEAHIAGYAAGLALSGLLTFAAPRRD